MEKNFSWIKNPPAIPLLIKEINNFGERVYNIPSGERFVSVTTMIDMVENKGGLNAWRESVGELVADYISETSRRTGTNVHKVIESYINNNLELDKDILVNAHFKQIQPLLEKINNVIFTEAALFSYAMKLAGTCDCIAEYGGKLSIIDFKTSSREKKVEWIDNYFIQATAYALMWEELTGNKINQIVIIITSRDGTVREYIENPGNFIKSLNKKLIEYSNIREWW